MNLWCFCTLSEQLNSDFPQFLNILQHLQLLNWTMDVVNAFIILMVALVVLRCSYCLKSHPFLGLTNCSATLVFTGELPQLHPGAFSGSLICTIFKHLVLRRPNYSKSIVNPQFDAIKHIITLERIHISDSNWWVHTVAWSTHYFCGISKLCHTRLVIVLLLIYLTKCKMFNRC